MKNFTAFNITTLLEAAIGGFGGGVALVGGISFFMPSITDMAYGFSIVGAVVLPALYALGCVTKGNCDAI